MSERISDTNNGTANSEARTPRFNRSKTVQVIISILVALALWVYVDVEKAPERTKTIRDVPVEFSGENTTLADKNLMLLSGYDTTIDLTIRGPKRELVKMSRDNVRVIASTSSIDSVGVHQLDWTVSFPDGVVRTNVSVEKASLSQITVTVGELYTKEVPVECQVIGEVAEGYFTGDVVLDPEVLTLRAQRDDLLNVSCAKLTVDISDTDKSYENAVGFTLYDYNDIAVDNSAIRPAVKLVQVKVPVKTTKEVPLEIVVKESAGSTLEQTSYTISPKSVTLAGEKDVLDAINSIALDTVYLQDISQSQTLYYEIIPPENTELVGDNQSATVTFTVTGVTEKTVTVNQFIVERVREGFRGQCTTESIQVTIRGLTDEIAAITDGQVVAVVDFSKLSTAGEYTLPVNIVVNGYDHISAKGNYQVNVRLDPDGAGESERDNT